MKSRVKRTAECGTDHMMLVARLDFPWTKTKERKPNNEVRAAEATRTEHITNKTKYKIHLPTTRRIDKRIVQKTTGPKTGRISIRGSRQRV